MLTCLTPSSSRMERDTDLALTRILKESGPSAMDSTLREDPLPEMRSLPLEETTIIFWPWAAPLRPSVTNFLSKRFRMPEQSLRMSSAPYLAQLLKPSSPTWPTTWAKVAYLSSRTSKPASSPNNGPKLPMASATLSIASKSAEDA